jgi:Xaa-Pro aminopeptidase
MFEYELQADADFVFKKFGAYGPSYYGLVATGRNTYYTHYHKGTARLEDGDLVQIDYGPDYKYYQGDITRVFPANGRFTPRQRELYTISVRLYQALVSSLKVHAAPRDIIRDAVGRMDAVMASYRFTDPTIKAAAVAYVDGYRNSKSNSLGHSIGMEVHDVGRQPATLEPGQLFCMEPPIRLEDEHLGVRVEDTFLVTENGCESLTGFVPLEPDAIEKLMAQRGLSEALAKPRTTAGR